MHTEIRQNNEHGQLQTARFLELTTVAKNEDVTATVDITDLPAQVDGFASYMEQDAEIDSVLQNTSYIAFADSDKAVQSMHGS